MEKRQPCRRRRGTRARFVLRAGRVRRCVFPPALAPRTSGCTRGRRAPCSLAGCQTVGGMARWRGVHAPSEWIERASGVDAEGAEKAAGRSGRWWWENVARKCSTCPRLPPSRWFVQKPVSKQARLCRSNVGKGELVRSGEEARLCRRTVLEPAIRPPFFSARSPSLFTKRVHRRAETYPRVEAYPVSSEARGLRRSPPMCT
ncbi:hypothetical protein C8R44DRAFT_804869 [Mycena epipterygia]|nr:hypothetical protein C8R44DRAFT_804869 [Mycena epipterygia]